MSNIAQTPTENEKPRRSINDWFGVSTRVRIITFCTNIAFIIAFVIAYFMIDDGDTFIKALFIGVLIKLVFDIVIRVIKI